MNSLVQYSADMFPLNNDCLNHLYSFFVEKEDKETFSRINKQCYAIWRNHPEVREGMFHHELESATPRIGIIERIRFWLWGVELNKDKLDEECHCIRKIKLKQRYFKEEFFSYIQKNCHQLETLILSQCIVKPHMIFNMKRLKVLQLPDCHLLDCHSIALGSMTQLEHLNIAGNGFTDDGVCWLGGMQKLRKLSLSCCFDLTDAIGDTVVKFTLLEELRLDFCTSITSLFFSKIDKLNLTLLSVIACTRLALRGGFASIIQFKSLKYLDISMIEVSSREFQSIEPLLKLQNLQVDCAAIQAEHCKSIAKLSQLEELSIGFNPLSYTGINLLKGCSNLKKLSLKGTLNLNSITISTLLQDNTTLQELDLRYCYKISELALNYIGSLKVLKISCNRESMFKRSDIQSARESFPGVLIET